MLDQIEEAFNPEDKITLNVPLFLRLLEYAKEDAKVDMDLHDVTEKAIALSEHGDVLTMDHYDQIVSGPSGGQDSEEPMKEAPEHGASKETIVDAIMGRMHHGHLDQALEAIREHGIEAFNNAVESEAEFHAGATELGSSDIGGMVKSVFRSLGTQESYTESVTECTGMPTGEPSQAQTTVSVNKTTSDAAGGSVTVSGNAKDTETLNQLLKLAGLNISVADLPMAPAEPEMPASMPATDVATVSIQPEFDDGPDMGDVSYSTNGTTLKDLLINRMRDKFSL